MAQEMMNEYAQGLQELTFNSKLIINNLTIIAGEQKVVAGAIVAAIEKHVLMCPAQHKLPAMYLMDSIMKNIGQPYVSLFEKNLVGLFLGVYRQVLPPEQLSLGKLAGTWRGLLSQGTVTQVLAAGQPAPVAAPPGQYGLPGYGMGMGYGGVHPGMAPPMMGPGMGMGMGMGVGPPPGGAPGVSIDPALLQSVAGFLNPPPGEAAAPPQAAASKPPSGLPSVAGKVVTPTEFKPEFLRAKNTDVLEALYFAQEHQCKITGQRFTTEAAYKRHLDTLFERNKKKRDDAAPAHQRWYVQEGAWLEGATAAVEEAPTLFQEKKEEKAPEKVYSVPVDPGHEKCAISGQRFETFWNEEVEEWHYKDAIRLQQPFGGAAAGALVHTSTLHQGDDEPEGGGKRGADGPEGGAAAKRPRV